MPKLSKPKGIELIIVELEKGTTKVSIMANFSEKWQTPQDTFNKWYIIAINLYKNNQESINKQLACIELEQKKESLKKAILSRDERMEILTSIAKGEIPLTKPMVCDGVIQEVLVVPNWMDRKNAISELNKMDGSYAPTKSEVDLKGEIKTTQLDLSKLSIETLLELDKNFKNIENLET